jgi:two-component system phosphate regulon response regulator PhoB
MGDAIFVIHDSRALRELVRKALESSGYFVAGAGDLAGAAANIEAVDPALFLLQWTGAVATEAVLGRLKSNQDTRASRIIVIASQDDIGEAIGTLEHGADDCLATPFAGEELVGRVNACFRRPPAVSCRDRVRAGPLLLDRVARRLVISEESVALAPTEFRLIEFLIEHHGRAFSRQELLQHAWPRHVKAGSRTVDVNIRRLRQALEPFSCDHMIQTVRGYGYRFSLEDVRRTASSLTVSSEFGRL